MSVGLRVGIDATALCYPVQAGVARYTRGLIEALRDGGGLGCLELRYRTSWKHRHRRPEIEGVRGRWTLDLPWPPSPRLDVVHDPSARAPRTRGPARVASLHDVFSLVSGDFANERLRRRRLKRYGDLVRRCRRIIASSHSTKRDFLRVFPDCPEERIVVIHMGVAEHFRRPPDEEISARRKQMDLSRPYLLFVGLLCARKNLVRMLDAFERSGLEDHVFVLAGELAYDHEKILAAAARLEGRVVRLGKVADGELPALYAGASALCFPTLYEGFGLPILESMRCETPVLTSTTGAAPEVAGGHALLVNPTDVDAIAQGMARVVALDPPAREAARRHAESFSWESCARATRVVYQEVVSG